MIGRNSSPRSIGSILAYATMELGTPSFQFVLPAALTNTTPLTCDYVRATMIFGRHSAGEDCYDHNKEQRWLSL